MLQQGIASIFHLKQVLNSFINVFSSSVVFISALEIQKNFSGSNTDGSFTTAVSNSFLSPKEKTHPMQVCDNLGSYLILINGILCVLIRIASTRRF